MQKGIVIAGLPQSGKTTKAKSFATNKTVWIQVLNKREAGNRFFWMDCNDDTDTVIVEMDVHSTPIEYFYNAVSNGVTVHKQGKSPFVIHPKIIIVVDLLDWMGTKEKYSESFKRRFDYIELPPVINQNM